MVVSSSLILGDGMGISTTTAARIFEAQSRNEGGEENVLSWEKFPYTALSKTYNVDAQVPDSAGTATAFATGVKTDKCEKRKLDCELDWFFNLVPRAFCLHR
jgi:alkaline phosphatase